MSIEDFTELMEQNIKVHEIADVQIKRLQSEVNDLKRRVRELEERNEN
jgi:vacuolar-type H+-ATPase subunit D/Vma8